MITLFAIVALQASPYSAQCLTEIAALSGERVDFMDPDRVAAATRKAELMAETLHDWSSATERLKQSQKNSMAALQRSEDEGRVPSGATAIEWDQRDRDMVARVSEVRHLFSRVPSCSFDLPAPVTVESLRAAR